MIESRLPFGASTAEKLMAVARWVPENSDHGPILPPSWRTLYQLTKLDGDQFEALIERGVIPACTRRAIGARCGSP